MIRSIAIAATLGALVAGVAAYAIYSSVRPRNPAAGTPMNPMVYAHAI